MSDRPRAPRQRPEVPRGLRFRSPERRAASPGTYRSAATEAESPVVVLVERPPFGARHITFGLMGLGWLAMWWFAYDWEVLGSVVFNLPIVAAGALSYWFVADLLNTTTLHISDGVLRVRHGPLPWFGNRATARLSDLEQLYTRCELRDPLPRRERWAVYAETGDGERLRLVTGLHDMLQAEFIEWAVESCAGIADDPSKNEI